MDEGGGNKKYMGGGGGGGGGYVALSEREGGLTKGEDTICRGGWKIISDVV